MSGSAVDGIVNELGQRFLWLHLLLPSHLQGGERVEAQGKAAALKTLLHLASANFAAIDPKRGLPATDPVPPAWTMPFGLVFLAGLGHLAELMLITD